MMLQSRQQETLVGRAQLRINHATLPEEYERSVDVVLCAISSEVGPR